MDVLVRGEHHEGVGLELGLDSALMLCAGTEKDNGRSNPSILADACEAVIGAVFFVGALSRLRVSLR